MARSIQARVEPSVLRWARETVNLTPLAAARKSRCRTAELNSGRRARRFPRSSSSARPRRCITAHSQCSFCPSRPRVLKRCGTFAVTSARLRASGQLSCTASTGARWHSGIRRLSWLRLMTRCRRHDGDWSRYPATMTLLPLRLAHSCSRIVLWRFPVGSAPSTNTSTHGWPPWRTLACSSSPLPAVT